MPPTDVDSLSLNVRMAPVRIGAPSPLPSISLSRDHINEALLKSPDNGATLDLAHKNISDVGEDGAEELATVGRGNDAEGEGTLVRCDVLDSALSRKCLLIIGSRIALAHNRLTTLPMAFALLSHLRYLVLKSNNFTVFPDVVRVALLLLSILY